MLTTLASKVVRHRHQLQEAGHQHVIDFRGAASVKHLRSVLGIAFCLATVTHFGGDARFLSMLQTARLGRTADHQLDL